MALISTLVVLCIASWRISMLMADADEGGPYNILSHIRNAIGVEFDERSEPYGTNVLSRMWVCYYCNSFWIGLTFTLLLFANAEVAFYSALPFAISGAVILIQER